MSLPDPALQEKSGSLGGVVVAAFPATGKSYFAVKRTDTVDSDSSRFSQHPNWPANYIAHIQAARRGFSLVLVSTHAEVRYALRSEGIPFTLVYPDPALRHEYRARMERRGSPQALTAKVCDELWDSALADCAAQKGCEHFVLGPGQYLADVLEEVRDAA